MNEISQFDIKYNKNKNNFGKLINFVEQYPDKRINISLSSPEDLDDIKVINKIHKNIFLKIDNLIFLNKMQKDDFKFYFTFPVSNYTQLIQFFQFPITDIYLADDLCYALKDVKNICKIHNVNTRLIINKIPTLGPKGLSIKDPIFRPEDSKYLSQFIDTIEFDCNNDWKKIEVLYNVWIKNQKWFGNLQEINLDIAFNFPNKNTIEIYRNKYNCDLNCIKGGVCNLCEDVLNLALKADSQNLIYKNTLKGSQ